MPTRSSGSFRLCWLLVASDGPNRPVRTPHAVSCSLPIPRKNSTIASIHSLILTLGVTSTVHGILTFFKRLGGHGLQSLHHRYVAWSKPNTTSLLLGTLTDLAKSKSELFAENARLASTTDHPPTAGETTCLYQDGSDASGASGQDRQAPGNKPSSLFRKTTRLALASSRLHTLVEVQVEVSFSQAENIPGDRGLDPGDGKGQPTVGSRTHSW